MNLKFFKKSLPTIIIMLVFSVAVISAIYSILNVEKQLPVFNPVDVNPRLVDSSVKHIRRDHKIADFELINQNGDTITQEDFEGKIYVADFFFTRCQTICPVMTHNLVKVQEAYLNDPEVMLLSHSVTPEMDSIPVLRDYADSKGVNDTKWHITTGDKKQIYGLARKSYFAVVDEGDGGLQDFIHTENFVLVDKDRQIRGYYDGTDFKDIQRLISDITLLKREYEK